MDADTAARLAHLVRAGRVAALGTLRDGAPNVSLVAYLAAPDFCAFWLRLSRLAWHTQDLARDARASLAILERDDGRADPQTLMRVTLRGDVSVLDENRSSPREDWLKKFPDSSVTFELADFAFWRFVPRDARFVAGLGKTHNLSAADLRAAASAAA
jgi:putative heme iron utilization protein